MHLALIIYIILQSLLFSVLLISRKKNVNKALTVYSIYLFLLHVLFILAGDWSGFHFSYAEIIGIALCYSGIVFFFPYSTLEKPIAEFQPSTQAVEPMIVREEEEVQVKFELSDEQSAYYQQVLDKLMVEDKIYLDPQLSLTRLARSASIPGRQLSKFILVSTQKNFKEYINSFRVRHAGKLLTRKEASQYTIYSIAFDSGFNSESSFYKIFKDETGLTPKQYHEKFAGIVAEGEHMQEL